MLTTRPKQTNRLLQLVRDNIEAPRAFSIKAEDGSAEILLYDGIGGWFGVEAADFVRELRGLDVGRIDLRINCPGGDVFDARAMQTALAQHPAEVVAHIDGLAASAATYVMMAADSIEMAKGAFVMIHKGWSLQIGNADEMRFMADLLDKVDGTIVEDYKAKTGLDDEALISMMAEETWMTADEAMHHGFVDSIFDPAEPVENTFNLAAYDHAPVALMAKPKEPESHEPDYAASLEMRSRRLRLLERSAA